MSPEVLLAAGYATALVVGALVLEWLSAHTHRRALRYRTAGFTYHAEHDVWSCPEGEELWPHEFDDGLRLVRYRAKPHICNGCALKPACTDSDLGREIVRPVDPWPHSEAGRFHRGLSLLLVALALLIVLVETLRHHAPNELAVGMPVLTVAAAAGLRLARDFRAHPANFPAPTPAHALGLTVRTAVGPLTEPGPLERARSDLDGPK
jgi:hypothetical protein